MKQKQKPLFSKEICYTKRLRVRTHVKFIMTCSVSLFSAMALALGTTAAVIHHNNYSGQGGGKDIDFEITELLPQTGAYEISGSDDDNGENVEKLLVEESDVSMEMDPAGSEPNSGLDAGIPDIIAEEAAPELPSEDIAENNVETSLSYKVYRVKTGDTVGVIAKDFGVSQDTIFSVNSNVITSAMSLRINSFLKIPSTSGILYTVQKDGETLESICKKNNVEAEKSEEANHIKATEKLKNGTTVFLVGAKMDRGKLLELSGELFKKPLHSAYYISSRYGWRISPFDSSRRTHHGGVDMACPKGTSIYPTSEGKVITAGWSGIYGNYVIVQHHSGYKSLYGHMSQILCKKGDYVYTNNVIGKVGSTGQSTGPHLHFTIYKNDKAINPETKLAL